MKLILGSGSPRRQQLLKEIFGQIEVRVKNVDESFPAHLAAEQISLFLAQQKAKAFENEIKKDELLVTADTIVWFDNHVLNKPADAEEAIQMLRKLAGNTHQVF